MRMYKNLAVVALWIVVGVGGAVLILCAFVAAATPSRSEDVDGKWVRQVIRQQFRVCDWDGSCYTRHRYRTVLRYQPPVYSYVQRWDGDRREGPRDCREIRKAVGDQHLTVDGAKKAANDAWAGTVRFHLGEKYMDLSNARRVTYTCSRSSIKEGGVTTLGQTLSRCEIEAQPCHPQRVEELER